MKYIILEKAKPYTRIKRGRLERVKGYAGRYKVISGFHVTPKYNVKEIIKTGFKPTSGTDGLYGVYFWKDQKSAKLWVPLGQGKQKSIIKVKLNLNKILNKHKAEKVLHELYNIYSTFIEGKSDEDAKILLRYPEYIRKKEAILGFINEFKKIEPKTFHRFNNMALQKMGYDAVESIWHNSIVVLDPSKIKVSI